MKFESMKFTNFNQLRKYSNFSENDNDKQLAIKTNLGKLLKNDIDLIEKISPRKKKHLKMLDIEEEESNKKFYDNFLNNLLSKEKRFITKSNYKNKKENNIPVQKRSAKLLRFNKFKFAYSLFNKVKKDLKTNNYNINKINDNDLIKEDKKEQKQHFKNKYMATTFEQQLELEEQEREKLKDNNNINVNNKININKNINNNNNVNNNVNNKMNINNNNDINDNINNNNNINNKIIEKSFNEKSSFHSLKKNNSSYILEQYEKNSENMKLKFLNKEIPYFKNDNNNNEIHVNTLLDKKSNKNTFQGDLEEKKHTLNTTPKSNNNYVINDIKKKKKFCFCCIPII